MLGRVITAVLSIGILMVSLTAPAGAQDETALRQAIRATYAFRPHELTSQQIAEKSPNSFRDPVLRKQVDMELLRIASGYFQK